MLPRTITPARAHTHTPLPPSPLLPPCRARPQHPNGLTTVAWLFEEPHMRTATPPAPPRAGALVYAPSVHLLPQGLRAVLAQLQGMGVEMGAAGLGQCAPGAVGCCLHVALPGACAVCGVCCAA